MSENSEISSHYPPITTNNSPDIMFQVHERRALAHTHDAECYDRAFRLLGDLSNRHTALRSIISTVRNIIDIEKEKSINSAIEHWQLAKGFKHQMEKGKK